MHFCKALVRIGSKQNRIIRFESRTKFDEWSIVPALGRIPHLCKTIFKHLLLQTFENKKRC